MGIAGTAAEGVIERIVRPEMKVVQLVTVLEYVKSRVEGRVRKKQVYFVGSRMR